MEWNGMEWNGMEWNGMEWNERINDVTATSRQRNKQPAVNGNNAQLSSDELK